MREGKRSRTTEAAWGAAALSALLAGLFTWVLGFLVNTGQSAVTTTLALLFGLSGYWMYQRKARRYGWIPTLIAIPLGFYFNYVGPHFQVPASRGATSLFFAAISWWVSRGPKPPADEP